MKYSVALFATAFALAAAGAAAAADYNGPTYDNYYDDDAGGTYDFQGLYLGAYVGGFEAGSTLYGAAGGVAGVNLSLSDTIYVGGEFQAGWIGGDGVNTWDALGLAHLGFELGETVMLYGAAGGGWQETESVYAVGGGLDVGVFDTASVRGEVLGVGAWGFGIEDTKATAALLFHVD